LNYQFVIFVYMAILFRPFGFIAFKREEWKKFVLALCATRDSKD